MACAEGVWTFRVNSCILWVHIKIPSIIIGTINTVGSALLKGLWCFQDWHPELRWRKPKQPKYFDVINWRIHAWAGAWVPQDPDLDAKHQDGRKCPKTESQNHFGWKGPLRPSSPACDWSLKTVESSFRWNRPLPSQQANPLMGPAEAQITVCVPPFQMKCYCSHRPQVPPEGTRFNIYNHLINTWEMAQYSPT